MDLNAEWIITNSNGSYASSTYSFANTRTYHGILVKRDHANFGATVLLSKLFEEIRFKDKTFSMDTNYYRDTVYPDGFKFIDSCKEIPIPECTFRFDDDHSVTKSLVMDQDSDTVLIRYRFSGDPPDAVYLYPLVSFRSFHRVIRSGDRNFSVDQIEDGIRISDGKYHVDILSSGIFYERRYWYYNFRYPRETERGTNDEEDLYNPGVIAIEDPGSGFDIAVTADAVRVRFDEVLKKYVDFRSINGDLHDLRYNSLSFLMHDDMIAGYHWFGPWGRDTFISMPGILLVSRRFNIARQILKKYAKDMKGGLIPNTLDIDSLHFSADTPLWFIYAVQKYHEYSSDEKFVAEMMPHMRAILDSYIGGTEMFRMEDNFIRVIESPLTWMDALIGGKAVTPRIGFPVEINALWYNALSFYSSTARKLGQADAGEFADMAEKVKMNFARKFVKNDSILDVSDPDDTRLRPNFLIGYFLPYPVMDDRRWVDLAWEKLVTPYGLRSLSPDDPDYVPQYSGPQPERDRAYHNGTVWPWLAGVFIKSAVRMGYSVRDLFEKFFPLFSMAKIPELFDGNSSGRPKGCMMQAWSHGEIIRSYFEDLRGAPA